MEATYINYQDTHSFSKALISYINQSNELKPFYSFAPDLDGFEKILAQKKSTCNRHQLVEVLKTQYNSVKASNKTAQNISLLSNDNTYTVTTGHQLNIFTGPLYFIYKIATAIKLASDLKEVFPDKNFVPVYWMATEDHDFAEINHTTLSGKTIQWDFDAKGATGHISTKSITDALKQYKGILGLSEHAERLAEIVKDAYLSNRSLAEATRYLVNELFSSYGLVIIDADDEDLKHQFAGIIEQDILNQNSYREITDSSNKLQQAGFHTQVNAREINFFYLSENLRERIVFENGKYLVLNTDISFTEDELKHQIRQFPERFSPNVVMRPLYQEYILPNIAYVGGGAEIVYWLQLKQNFDFYKLTFPVLILRNSAAIVPDGFIKKLNRLGLNTTDLFEDTESLKKRYVLNHSSHQLNVSQEWEEIKKVFDALQLRVSQIDPTLKASTAAIAQRLHKQLANLEKKLLKAEKRNYATAITQLEKLKEVIFPNGALQERTENFGLQYARFGNEFINDLLTHFKPLAFQFTVLH